MNRQPIIGITSGYLKKNDYVEGPYAHQDYITSLFLAGAVPIILPVAPEDVLTKYVELCDGFIFSGGDDIHPKFYNESPSPYAGTFDVNRDLSELKLFKKVWATKKPIFGVCRGTQLINVALGGTLIQDISHEKDSAILHTQKEPRGKESHQVRVEKNSKLSEIFDFKQDIYVNSLHHQSIGRLAPALKPVAFAPDGIIEAVEYAFDHDFIAVQWHPESMAASGNELMKKLFSRFVENCLDRMQLLS